MSQLYYQTPFFEQFSEDVILAETTRLGGVSKGAYNSLNLSVSRTNDSPANVLENRRRLAQALHFDVDQWCSVQQVHGADVLTVNTAGEWGEYDAMISNTQGLVLSITVADCTPVLIYDPIKKCIGAAHAGWKGTVGQIAQKTLEKMCLTFGAKAENCVAYIGSCIGKDDFEVDADVADHFAAAHKYWDTQRQKYFVDLKAANQAQLLAAGIAERNIIISPYSTYQRTDRYFSYRAEKGHTGRFAVLIALR